MSTRALRLGLAVLLSTSLAVSPSPALADDEPPSAAAVETASLHFERGVRLFEDGDARLALVEFERSYAAVPDYRTLFNIGQVQLKLGAFAEARRTLERYLSEGGDRVPPARKETVQKNLEGLALRTAHLVVRVREPGTELRLDGTLLGVSPLPRTLVSSGSHTLTASKPGFETENVGVSLVGGDERSIDLELRPVRAPIAGPAPPPERSGPTLAQWAAWGATGVLAAGTVGMTFAWQSASSDLDSAKGRVTTRGELDDKKSTVETRMTLAAALGAATLVAAGAAVYLTVRSSRSSPARAALTPLGLHGTF